MFLNELVECKLSKELEKREVSGICFDSEHTCGGDLFFALVGSNTDGHKYIFEAYALGAVAAVVEQRVECPITQIVVPDTRRALSYAAKKFHRSACDKLNVIALTGTNGKTTTAHMLKSILALDGKNVGVIGTNGVSYGKTHHPGTLTTPDPTELHETFDKMHRANVTHVVMEASAHALALNKLDCIGFAAAGFSNLTQDHLDYFGNMQAYKRAKLKLFENNYSRIAVTNLDDACGKEVAALRPDAITYSLTTDADVTAKDLKLSARGASFTVCADGREARVTLQLPGRYNAENALHAITLALALGTDLATAAQGIAALTHVDGRVERLEYNGATVIIDFAHTEDGLKNLIQSTREYIDGKVITLFGCGGNRDRTKRPKMGSVAARYSDVTVVTSDNPRDEQPESIIADVEKGIKEVSNAKYILIPDRKTAIASALKLIKPGDALIIAGKGAERYYECGGVKFDYNDREFVLSLIGETK